MSARQGCQCGAVASWDPDQYQRFKDERSLPFFDLLGLIQGETPTGRVVDLGCGSGELTVELHKRLRATETLGIDNSAAMLARARGHERTGLSFEEGDIGRFTSTGEFDVVFSNAALQWVPNHGEVLARWSRALRPGGQLAVQLPANADHPSHGLAAELAAEDPFREALTGDFAEWHPKVLSPEQYALALHDLGFASQHVRLQVYGHELASSCEVVEWVRGTALLRYQGRLSDEMFGRFLSIYTNRLLEAIGDRAPYFYAFKRILLWGRLGSDRPHRPKGS